MLIDAHQESAENTDATCAAAKAQVSGGKATQETHGHGQKERKPADMEDTKGTAPIASKPTTKNKHNRDLTRDDLMKLRLALKPRVIVRNSSAQSGGFLEPALS